MDNPQNKSTAFKVIGALVVVGLAGFFGLKMRSDEAAPVTPDTNLPVNSGANEVTETKYRDGIYSADGAYVSPAGAERISITLTLKDDVITLIDFTGHAVHPTSKLMQGKFSEGFETLVSGKAIDEISLMVVNGSSLAPKGFMEALSKIKAEAEA